MKRIGVMTSGGDSPGMNACIRAVVRGAIYNGMEVYGIKRGYEGLIDGEIEEMGISSVADIIQRGGTILRTARSDRFLTKEGFSRALNMLETFGIEGLAVIGGDGSLRGGVDLTRAGITVMGLPGTIDNDLAYTDYTIGFDTAVNTALMAIGNTRDTSSSHGRTTVIEVMGRHCGDIALYAGLAGGAETILVPEEKLDVAEICKKLLVGKNRGKLHSIIIKAEGVNMSSEELRTTLEERTGLETKVVILGYIQRGGSPTARDRLLASRTGYRAVELFRDGSTSKAIGIRGEEIIAVEISDALKTPKIFNAAEIIELSDILS
ncbi:MAG: 6-phosphofructokinase [Bacillota bacterium]|nr:6-phosphofructokinase [Bacillota bacterium]NLV70567.1 6-phosphofructokinase [Clostridiales bacterium]HPF18417.1 6-phosphofructokinase [Bacillota bacterium]